MREVYSSGTKWESLAGYARAVKVGDRIHISGTTATGGEGEIIGVGDYYKQTIQTIRNLQSALAHFGAGLKDVYRTRIFVTDIGNWHLVAKAHGEYFKYVLPASTMLEVSALIHPDLLVEIEAEALLEN